MSGAMTAFACAAAGLKPILLEADRIGLGGSGRATGLLSGEAAESFRDVEARAGRRVARALFAAMESAPRDLAATVKRLGIKAGLKAGPGLRVIPPNQTDKALRKEIAAREAAALTASFLMPAAIARQTAIESAGGMRMPDGGFADPFKLTLGFLSAAIKRGARVYERSSVNKITFTRKTATAFLNERRHHDDEPRDLHRRADQPVQAVEAAPAPRASLCGADRTVVGRGARGTGPARGDAARHRIAVAPPVVHDRSPRLVCRRRSEASARSTARQDAGPAHRRIDVRADETLSGDLRRRGPSTAGTCRSRIRWTACSMPARIATFRFSCSRSERRTIPPARFSRAGSSCATFSASPKKTTCIFRLLETCRQ